MMTQRLLDSLTSFFEIQNSFLDYEGLAVSFRKNRPATQQEISSLLSEDNLKLPGDYLRFLQATNRCVLYQYRDLGGFEFLGTNDIAKENQLHRQTYQQDWDNRLTVFCNVLGDGDFLSFRIMADNSYEIVDCYHDDNPKNWNVISNSFNDFLERLIQEKGRRFWL